MTAGAVGEQSITGSFSKYIKQTIKLESLVGFKAYQISSTITDENGNFFINFSIADYGVGYLISEENKPYVFEPKFTTKTSGMGLGLGIIKKIIENYNGTITFESQPNVGTKFIVSFPIITNVKTI